MDLDVTEIVHLQCPECKKIFTDKNELSVHKLNHSKNEKTECKLCGQIATTVGHNCNKFKCIPCNIIFKNELLYQDHRSTAHTIIKDEFSGVDTLLNSIDIIQNKFKQFFKKGDRKRKISNKENQEIRNNHKKLRVAGEMNQISELDEICFDDVPFKEKVKVLIIFQGVFQCQSCNEIFDDLKKLSQHMLNHSFVSNDYNEMNETFPEIIEKKEENYENETYEESLIEVVSDNEELATTSDQENNFDMPYYDGVDISDCNSDNESNSESDTEFINPHGSSAKTGVVFFPNRRYKNMKDTSKSYKTMQDIYLKKRIETLENDVYNCIDCNIQFETLQKAGDHMTTHEIRLKWKNFVVARNDENIINEYISDIRVIPYGSNVNKIDENGYECKICTINSRFNNIEEISRHMLTKHNSNDIYRCFLCQKLVMTKRKFSLHIHTKHNLNKKDFICRICNKNYKTNHSLLSHIKNIHSASNIKTEQMECDICKKKYAGLNSLKLHMKRYHLSDNKKFECDVCHQKFLFQSYLDIHKKNHSDRKHYFCELCGQGFKYKKSLVLHAQSHLGIKKFKCEVCDQSFNHTGDFKVHKRLHTGERPYICKICDQRFIASTNLTKHMRSRHPECLV